MPRVLLFLALAFPLRAQDPVRVWATLSSPSVQVGETVVLELNVETRGPAPDDIDLPTFPAALDVVGTRDYSQIQFSLPGGRSRIVRREIVLRALAPGRYRIPPTTVEVQGSRYRTRALTLTVSGRSGGYGGAAGAPGGGAGMRGGSESSSPGGAIVFRAKLTPDTVYVGQQVTLDAEVMISEDAQLRLRRTPEYMPPSAPGFWIHDLPNPGPAQPRTIGGQVYRARSFARAYFPLVPGRYTLPPARLLYEIRRGFFYTPDSRELSTDSLRLVVLPVPESGRPATYTGAVGRFEIRTRVEPAEAVVGEAVALTVEVEGVGNIKALPAPALPPMDGIEVHPPSEDADVTDTGGVLAGSKRFTWILIPREPGRIELPAVEYAYFDPTRAVFERARAAPLVLRVRPGAGEAVAAARPVRLRGLKLAARGAPALGWVRSPAFAAVQLVPLLALLGIMGWRHGGDRPRSPSRRALRRQRRAAFAALRAHAAAGDFFRELGEQVRGWLAERLAEPALARAVPATIQAALPAHGVSTELATEVARLVERIDRARFEPGRPGTAARLALLDDAARLLDAVDDEASVPRRATGAGAAVILALALVGGVVGRPARAAPPQDFERGIELYMQGDYAAAVRAFAAVTAARPRDPSGWYNLGNAYYENGENGRAIWAWLRARRLAPRDADIRHNLALAEADAELVRRTAPFLALSTEELLLCAGLAWLLGTTALTWYALRRRRWAAVLGAAGVVAAFSLLGGWGAPRLRERAGIILPAEVPLRAAPDLRAETLRALEAGAGVVLVDDGREGWLRVRTWEGGEGWVEAAQVGVFYGAPPAL